ncbi:MAG: hypothetical protein CVV42_17270 [Candidatus Riflebacteria bacterium HGW-Riflebacteria-2]|jgi:hypothetical protein|nr:MAG: hypothetical protein CVV42_17270 [Candidatus Riflebacteria bacterium HGW-Riflebacteria-2]
MKLACRIGESGLSMAELVVAVSVIAMAIGPLIALLTSSNQMSNHSIQEEMSVHYCREITDQLLRLAPKIPFIVESARKITGNNKLSFADLINDSGFNKALANAENSSDCVAFQNLGLPTEFRILISKMDKVFKFRQIRAERLDSSSNRHFKDLNYWKIIVTVGWQPSENAPDKQTQTVIIIGESS